MFSSTSNKDSFPGFASKNFRFLKFVAGRLEVFRPQAGAAIVGLTDSWAHRVPDLAVEGSATEWKKIARSSYYYRFYVRCVFSLNKIEMGF